MEEPAGFTPKIHFLFFHSNRRWVSHLTISFLSILCNWEWLSDQVLSNEMMINHSVGKEHIAILLKSLSFWEFFYRHFAFTNMWILSAEITFIWQNPISETPLNKTTQNLTFLCPRWGLVLTPKTKAVGMSYHDD